MFAFNLTVTYISIVPKFIDIKRDLSLNFDKLLIGCDNMQPLKKFCETINSNRNIRG